MEQGSNVCVGVTSSPKMKHEAPVAAIRSDMHSCRMWAMGAEAGSLPCGVRCPSLVDMFLEQVALEAFEPYRSSYPCGAIKTSVSIRGEGGCGVSGALSSQQPVTGMG